MYNVYSNVKVRVSSLSLKFISRQILQFGFQLFHSSAIRLFSYLTIRLFDKLEFHLFRDFSYSQVIIFYVVRNFPLFSNSILKKYGVYGTLNLVSYVVPVWTPKKSIHHTLPQFRVCYTPTIECTIYSLIECGLYSIYNYLTIVNNKEYLTKT